jgi:hypothetical protein
MTYIYALAHPLTCEIRYVGKAVDPPDRLARHMKGAGHGRTPVSRWLGKLVRHGLQPQLQILAEVDDDVWQIHERMWIAALRESGTRLLNQTDGGDGASGELAERNKNCFQNWYNALSDDEKKAVYKGRGFKIAKTRTLNGTTAKGKKLTNEQRARQSAAVKAAWADPVRSAHRRQRLVEMNQSPERRVKVSAQVRSPESRALTGRKISEAWANKEMSEEERSNRRAAQQRRRERERKERSVADHSGGN